MACMYSIHCMRDEECHSLRFIQSGECLILLSVLGVILVPNIDAEVGF